IEQRDSSEFVYALAGNDDARGIGRRLLDIETRDGVAPAVIDIQARKDLILQGETGNALRATDQAELDAVLTAAHLDVDPVARGGPAFDADIAARCVHEDILHVAELRGVELHSNGAGVAAGLEVNVADGGREENVEAPRSRVLFVHLIVARFSW